MSLVKVWYRLELALNVALKGTSVRRCRRVHLVHLLYRKPPKKLRQLKELVDAYDVSEEFDVQTFRPKKASGTRWISHKIDALNIINDKYGIHIQHLKEMAEDKSYPSADRAKFKGWLKKWSAARIPLLVSFYIEILTPAKILSKCFQTEVIDVVSVPMCVERVKRQVNRLKNTEFRDLPTVKRTIEKVDEEDGSFTIQGVKIEGYAEAVKNIENQKSSLLQIVIDSLSSRLEHCDDDNCSVLLAKILNTDGWSIAEEEINVMDDDIEKAFKMFEIPLKRAGVSSLNKLLVQWHVLQYTNAYLSPSKVNHKVIWRNLFSSNRAQDWGHVLIPAELLFCLPVSNALVERFFSFMKRVKTDQRASLGEKRLNSLLRICVEGPDMKEFDPDKAIDIWARSSVRVRVRTCMCMEVGKSVWVGGVGGGGGIACFPIFCMNFKDFVQIFPK